MARRAREKQKIEHSIFQKTVALLHNPTKETSGENMSRMYYSGLEGYEPYSDIVPLHSPEIIITGQNGELFTIYPNQERLKYGVLDVEKETVTYYEPDEVQYGRQSNDQNA